MPISAAKDEEHRQEKIVVGEKDEAADDESRGGDIEEIDGLSVREAALDQAMVDVVGVAAEQRATTKKAPGNGQRDIQNRQAECQQAEPRRRRWS